MSGELKSPNAYDSRVILRTLERSIGGGWRWGLFGPDGVKMWHGPSGLSVICTQADYDDVEWRHASIACKYRIPTYDELATLHKACFADGYSYQQFVPRSSHVNIHAFALHLWGRADGQPAIPDFGAMFGSI